MRIVKIFLLCLLLLTLQESYQRKYDPSSLLRPSNFFNEIAEFLGSWARYIGSLLAYCIDIYNLLKDYVYDLHMVLKGGFNATVYPVFEFVKGFWDYFKQNYPNFAELLAVPISFMLVGFTLFIGGLIGEKFDKMINLRVEN